ncbi:MAG: competence protein ComK [Bacillus sp. (in: firmicutes)]
MKEYASYLIVQTTIVLIPWFAAHGELFSIIIEGELKFMVRKSPRKIIEESLLSYGSEWKGALKAAKHNLGDHYMPPIKISGLHGLYFIPDQSPYNPGCSFISLHHVVGTQAAEKSTSILLQGGHRITIKMKEKSFREKWNRAKEYKQKMEQKREGQQEVQETIPGFSIVKEDGALNYRIFDE